MADVGKLLRGSFLSRAKIPVRSNRRSVPSVKPATAIRPLGTRVRDVPIYYVLLLLVMKKNSLFV